MKTNVEKIKEEILTIADSYFFCDIVVRVYKLETILKL